jgi:hypothetical protein
MDKRANASMLGYLANAYAQRGDNDAAVTTLAACYHFQRNKGVADAIASFRDVGAKVMDAPHRLDGQIYALASVFIPIILFTGIYTAVHLFWLHWSARHSVDVRYFTANAEHFMKQMHSR